jgi:hypothetical protein
MGLYHWATLPQAFFGTQHSRAALRHWFWIQEHKEALKEAYFQEPTNECIQGKGSQHF